MIKKSKTVKRYKAGSNEVDLEIMNDMNTEADPIQVVSYASNFVSAKRAAKMMGISLPTLRKYARSGFITTFKLGHRHFYHIDELEMAKRNIF